MQTVRSIVFAVAIWQYIYDDGYRVDWLHLACVGDSRVPKDELGSAWDQDHDENEDLHSLLLFVSYIVDVSRSWRTLPRR